MNLKHNLKYRYGRTFLWWIVSAAIHGICVTTITLHCYKTFNKSFESPKNTSWYDQSTLVYSTVVILVQMKLLVELNRMIYITLYIVIVFGTYVSVLAILSDNSGAVGDELLDIDDRALYSSQAQTLMFPIACLLVIPDILMRAYINHKQN